MANNPAIFVLGEGIGKRGGNFKTTEGLYDLYGPERLRDTPICERGFVGLACGAAMTGTRPVVDFMFADFVLDAVGEILNQIAKMQYMSSGRHRACRCCCAAASASATRRRRITRAITIRCMPISPACAWSCPRRRTTPRACSRGPCAATIRCCSSNIASCLAIKGPVPEGDYEIDFGQAAVVREGRDVTVVALALMVRRTLEACERLACEGHLGGGDRSAHRVAAGRRDDPALGPQDGPAA